MKRCLLALLWATQTLITAQEISGVSVQTVGRVIEQAPRSWLGLDVAKPEESTYAHLPQLPQGMGFVVKTLYKGGPAEKAGMREYDLIWKIADQMLVNEAQLATLLRLWNPGETVKIAAFRAGQPLEISLKLGEAPLQVNRFPGDIIDSAVLPGASGPMRVVNVAEKSATLAAEDGHAAVTRDGENYKVEIIGNDDRVIFSGKLTKDDSLDKIPEMWRRKVQVLCRTLDQALAGGMTPQRQPRPRVVPPPVQKP